MSASRSIINSLSKIAPADHRLIGAKQRLFFFDQVSQGSCFFEPRGAHIYNRLVDYLKKEYRIRGYEEVITPNIYSCKLWETSGHWEHYRENMIRFHLGENEHSLKPMNCPGHCVMFKQQKTRTSKELPVRWADFGVLHRNELSGSILGLSRARRFQQDDAHIFCTPQQVEDEVQGCLDFAKQVYRDFGFSFDVNLSLRPETYLGESSLWDKAENSLRSALERSKIPYKEQKFEGAFYGPKIDLNVEDTQQRSRQCATIQLDFQLPERFELEFKDSEENVKLRPVMIHRAILGSLERFIAMLAEHYRGRWPFWLSPLQAQVIPIHESQNSYARQVQEEFRELGFWVDCDLSGDRLNAKVREASLLPYNLILLVGQNEERNRSVTCRLVEPRTSVKCQNSAELDNNPAGKTNERLSTHNLNITVDVLKNLFVDFEKCRVERADIKLLDEWRRRERI